MSSTSPREGSARGQRSSTDTGSTAGQDLLADQLSALARELQDQDDVEQTLRAVVHAAVGTVPGAEHASVSAVERRRQVHTRAATGELAWAMDAAQYETGQGPCLDTLYAQRTVRVADTSAEQRWPRFTRRAVELGVGSLLSVQLYVEGDDLGALNLLSGSPEAFADESEHVALLFASHAAVAMASAQQEAQLSSAVTTRDLIGQAKGILMERFKVSGDQAFALLVRVSQVHNRKLHEVAEELTRHGELPGQPSPRRGPAGTAAAARPVSRPSRAAPSG